MQAGVLPMEKDPVPESVIMIAEVALDVMAVWGVNVTVTLVVAPLIWEPKVMLSPVMVPYMAGNAPVSEMSRRLTPSLVVHAATLVMAGCGTVGRVNCAKFKVIAESC